MVSPEIQTLRLMNTPEHHLRLIHTDGRIRKMPRSHDDELNGPVLVDPELSPLNFNILWTKNVEKIR